MNLITPKDLKGFVKDEYHPYTDYSQEIADWLKENGEFKIFTHETKRYIFSRYDKFYTHYIRLGYDVYYTNEQFKEWIGMTTPKKLIKDYFTEDFYTPNTKEVGDYLEKNFEVSDQWTNNQEFITTSASHTMNGFIYFFTTDCKYRKFIDTETFKEIIGMNEFKLEDLVSGKHVVEYRDGQRRLVLDVGWVGIDQYRYDFDGYNSNMEFGYYSPRDVVKVFELRNARIMPELLNHSNLTLVWERKEAPVETAQEKAKKEAEAQLRELSQQIEALQKQAEAIMESVGKM